LSLSSNKKNCFIVRLIKILPPLKTRHDVKITKLK
jgi:hypothetical protein